MNFVPAHFRHDVTEANISNSMLFITYVRYQVLLITSLRIVLPHLRKKIISVTDNSQKVIYIKLVRDRV